MYVSSRRKRHEEYKSMVRDKVKEAEWKYLDLNEHSQQKNIMMETAQDIRGMWWNEKVAEAVRKKKNKYGNWKRENSTKPWKEYKRSR